MQIYSFPPRRQHRLCPSVCPCILPEEYLVESRPVRIYPRTAADGICAEPLQTLGEKAAESSRVYVRGGCSSHRDTESLTVTGHTGIYAPSVALAPRVEIPDEPYSGSGTHSEQGACGGVEYASVPVNHDERVGSCRNAADVSNHAVTVVSIHSSPYFLCFTLTVIGSPA